MPNSEYTTEQVAPGIVRARPTAKAPSRQRQAEVAAVRRLLDEVEPGPTRILLVMILRRLGLYQE